MPKVFWHPEAQKEVLELSEEKQKLIDERVSEFKEKGMEYKHFGRVSREEHSFNKYKIKLKEENPVEINQRVILDVYHDQWIIYGVQHRDNAYKKPFIKLVKEREY